MDDFTILNDYGTSYSSYGSADSAAAAGVAVGVFIFMMVMALAIYIVSALLLSSVFKKAGVAPWKAWVPILNSWKILEIGGQQGFWAILAIVPIANIVAVIFMIIAMHNINRKLSYDVGMTVLAIFLPLIWLIILAISKNPWNEQLGAPRTDRPDTVPVAQVQPGQQPPVPPIV